jgi:predicted AlkP superfamily phosphohydrolase/phosphomutase
MNESARHPDKVWVIGLDGATFDLVRPWAEAGYLPTLARLMAEGAWGELESTIHPLTASAWTTFLTGLNPGRHGIYDFTRRRLGSYDLELVNASARAGRSLWRILSDAGRRVGVVNVPMTYPPEPVNGYLVAGLDAPSLDSPYTYPSELAQHLRGRHIISVSTVGKTLGQYLTEMLDAVEGRFAVVHMLLEREQPDFFMKVIVETDAIQHAAWHLLDRPGEPGADAILQVYRRIDERLGELLAGLPSDVTLVVMSDHGAGPIAKVIDLDRWLEDNGLFRLQTANVRKRWLRSVVAGAQRYAQRHLPARVKGMLRQSASAMARVDSFLLYSGIDWSRTRAYSIGNQGNICINLAGREPNGIVSASEYETLRDEIIAGLSELRDPDTGEPVVDRVYRREELYTGERVHLAPDLLIRWRDDRYVARKDFAQRTGELFRRGLKFSRHANEGALDQTGTHRLHGMLILHGEAVQAGTRIVGARLVDLAPTILYLMGEPIPAEMEGRVLTEPLRRDFVVARPLRAEVSDGKSGSEVGGSGYDAEEEERVRERLRGLGYVA